MKDIIEIIKAGLFFLLTLLLAIYSQEISDLNKTITDLKSEIHMTQSIAIRNGEICQATVFPQPLTIKRK